MASVAYDQAQVVVLGEENTSLYMGYGRSFDIDRGEVAASARISRVGGRPARVVGEVGPQASSGKVDPGVVVNSQLCRPMNRSILTATARWHSSREHRRTEPHCRC